MSENIFHQRHIAMGIRAFPSTCMHPDCANLAARQAIEAARVLDERKPGTQKMSAAQKKRQQKAKRVARFANEQADGRR